MSSSPAPLLKSTVPLYVSSDDVSGDILAAVQLPLRQFGAPRVEIWPAAGRVEHGTLGAFRYAHDGDLLFASATFDGPGGIETLTRRAYDEAIRLSREQGYPNLMRMWNHVGSINADDHGCERYKLFCEGRHDAFAAAGYRLDTDLPAASAVGMPGRGLMLYFIAAKDAGTQVENPRQVAAYRYPPQYGVKSPSFSRATLRRAGGETIVYVSGTSSVVGHASVHERDALAQLEETMRNVEAILGNSAGATLADLVAVKTYIRRANEADAVMLALDTLLPRGCSRIYLEADICRRELLLEIEGVARLTRP